MTQYTTIMKDKQGRVRSWSVSFFMSVSILEAETKWPQDAERGTTTTTLRSL